MFFCSLHEHILEIQGLKTQDVLMSLHNISVLREICKRNSSSDSKWKSLGAVTRFKCCVLLCVQCFSTPVSLSLYCSKIRRYANAESSWTTLVLLLRCSHPMCRKRKFFGSPYIKLLCVCAHMWIWKIEEEFGVAVAHFFSFSYVFPLSLQYCQSPWGRLSTAAIGRPRLSKYTF